MYANATRLLLLLRALIIMILAAPVDATVALQFVTFAPLSLYRSPSPSIPAAAPDRLVLGRLRGNFSSHAVQ